MRFKALAVLVVAAALLGPVFHPQSRAEEPAVPSANEGTPIPMHFKGQGLTTAGPAAGNSTEEKTDAPGRPWGARFSGTVIGEWAFLPTGEFQIQGSFKAELWAGSTQGAKNAGFRLNFYIGNSLVRDMYSDRADVSSPHKFTISDSVTATVRAGTQVRVGLVWLSDPNYFIGPSSAGQFYYGSKEHDSKIIMTLNGAPVSMNLTGYEKEKDALKLNARYNESLGMDPAILTYRISMIGPGTTPLPDHFSKSMVVASENGTMVSWLWYYKKSKAQSGLYTVTLTLEYCNDTAFTNQTQLEVRFSVEQKVEGLAVLTQGNNLIFTLLAIIMVAVVVSVVSVVGLRRRRRKRARLAAERDIVQAA